MSYKNNINLEEIFALETERIIEEILGKRLNSFDSNFEANNSEREKQSELESGIKNRGVRAPLKKSKKDGEEPEKTKNRDRLNQRKGFEEEDDPKEEPTKQAPKEVKPDQQKQSEPSRREDRTGGKGTPDSPKLKPPMESLMNPSFDDIMNGVSLIRGGKSTKNPEIQKQLRSYYEALSSAERRALNAFLLGVAQVLATIDDPVEPSDAGVRFKVKKDSAQPNPNIKTDISASQKSKDLGTQNNPIVVGERANKQREYVLLASYRRF